MPQRAPGRGTVRGMERNVSYNYKMVTELHNCDCTKTHGIVHIKRMNFM